MKSLVKTLESFAPLAKGPLQRPDGYHGNLKTFRTKAIGCYGLLYLFFGTSYYIMVYNPLQKMRAAVSEHDPDELFEEMKEYGVFKGVKASWQE